MFCPKCGLELPEEANFCLKCGCEVSKYKTPTQSTGDSSDRTLGNMATIGADLAESLGDGKTIEASAPLRKDGPRYEILSRIGQGGMGVVYKARDNRLRRIVALKRLRSNLSDSQNAIDRFFNEAKSIATLNHQNIVQIYDYGEDLEGHYISMEYVDGVTIRDYLKEKGKLNAEEATRIILSLARGLAVAHERGVIHRDIKPGNILLEKNNKAKLTDFGLARVVDSEDITKTGFMMGTPDYCSPEQLRDAKNVDYRADIYSLGATFYEMVVGQSPKYFREENIPAGVQPLIKKAMASDPKRRYQNVLEFIEAFEGEVEEETTEIKVACPQCGLRNPTDVKYCIKCGNSLSHLFDMCPKCQRENRVDVEYCGGCGYNVYNFRRIQKLTDKAFELREQQKYTEAIGSWEKILDIEPDNQKASGEFAKDKETVESIEKLCNNLEQNRTKQDWLGIISTINELKKLSQERASEFKSLEDETEAHFRSALQSCIEKNDYQAGVEIVERLVDLKGETDELGAAFEDYTRKGKEIFEVISLTRKILNDQKNPYQALARLEEIRRKYPCNEEIISIERELREKIIADQEVRFKGYRILPASDEMGKLPTDLQHKSLRDETELHFRCSLQSCIQNDDYQVAVKITETLMDLSGETDELKNSLADYESKAKEISEAISWARNFLGPFDNPNNAFLRLRELRFKYPQNVQISSTIEEIRERLIAYEEVRFERAKKETEEFKQGKKSISEAIQAWQEYLNISGEVQERSLADKALQELNRDEDKLRELLQRLEDEFESKQYKTCNELMRSIREIEKGNSRCLKVEKIIKEKSDEAERYRIKAEEAMKQLDYEAALQKLHAALSSDPHNSGLLEEIRKTSDIVKALNLEIEELNTRLKNKEDLEEEVQRLSGLIIKYPKSQQLLQLRDQIIQNLLDQGRNYLFKGRYGKAIRKFEGGLKLNPKRSHIKVVIEKLARLKQIRWGIIICFATLFSGVMLILILTKRNITYGVLFLPAIVVAFLWYINKQSSYLGKVQYFLKEEADLKEEKDRGGKWSRKIIEEKRRGNKNLLAFSSIILGFILMFLITGYVSFYPDIFEKVSFTSLTSPIKDLLKISSTQPTKKKTPTPGEELSLKDVRNANYKYYRHSPLFTLKNGKCETSDVVIEVMQVRFCDLNSDGRKEAVVLLSYYYPRGSGSGMSISAVEKRDGKVIQIDVIEVDGDRPQSPTIKIESGLIIIDYEEFLQPGQRKTGQYKFVKDKFVKQ